MDEITIKPVAYIKNAYKDLVNYILTINVDLRESLHATNFHAEEISEEEFHSIN